MLQCRTSLVSFFLILTLSVSASAVLIKGPDGSANTTAPSVSGVALPYWDSIGQTPNSSGQYSGGGSNVYLGGGWVLTAWHIRVLDNPNKVKYGSTEYTIDTSSWQRLDNGTNDADLGLFRISGTLPNVLPVPYDNIPSSVPNGTEIYTMGFGRERDGGETTYYIKNGTLYTSPPSHPYQTLGGFDLLVDKALRWGTNTVDSHVSIDDGAGITDAFQIDFDANGGHNESQLTNGDSGGPAFIFDDNDDTWKLVGLNIAQGPGYTDQGLWHMPYTSGGYNAGFIADLSQYQGQLVPEPATVGLLGVGGLFMLIRRKRR